MVMMRATVIDNEKTIHETMMTLNPSACHLEKYFITFQFTSLLNYNFK